MELPTQINTAGVFSYGTPDEAAVAVLTGAVYEEAPGSDKIKFIEHLLKPLGVIAAAGVANGAFAQLAFNLVSGRGSSVEDIRGIQAQHVVKLADRVQELGLEAFVQLSRWVMSSPTLATTATSALFIAVLAHKTRNRRCSSDPDLDPPLA